MARPRLLNDDQILQRVGDALGDVDAAWTLAGAAAAAGLHPATLIKRFGSRRGLLVALSQRWVSSIPSKPTSDDAHQELLAWVDSTCASEVAEDQMLTRIDMLVEDLRDPELRALLHDGWQRNIDYLTGLVNRARQDGQMREGISSVTIAHLLLDTAHGSLLRAAVTPGRRDTAPACTTQSLLEALT
ncbi:hypothetical protein [Nocardioides sp.]|uniref:hypothetical protein n=1 Tax=Nocardioides sp. TaxID=35761 RepID=UPI002C5ECAA1|nr:hypothetical protein [Nocardioides sp.]HXH79325.1 hypothetical protein [Nocardioides sp.]